MSYKGKNKKIMKTMKQWSGTIMMSNRKELVLCKPSSSGWETETIIPTLKLTDKSKKEEYVTYDGGHLFTLEVVY